MKTKTCITSLLFAAAVSFTACGQKAEASKKENVSKPADAAPQMQYVLHKAGTRGETKTGWLLAKHTFSFNNYYDAQRMNFGALRVLNDDRIDPAKGFPSHDHDNMEIITIPLKGAVHHKDNMGNSGAVRTGDIQVMSAGIGVKHSESNDSNKDTLRLLQIWVDPNKANVKPRYQQVNGILDNIPANSFKTVVSPNDSSAIFLYQDAVFSMGKFDKNKRADYNIAFKGNGVYAFIIEGNAKINGIEVSRRDGIGIWNTDKISIEATSDLQVLLMEVPMKY